MKRIVFTAAGRVEILRASVPPNPLQPREVRGRTLVSLVSPGTELNLLQIASFPFYPGYACVFQVDEIGTEVRDLSVGDRVFGSGPHQEFQTMERAAVVPLPPGLDASVAVFARLAGVSMSTLNTTTVRPPARVLVTGLGPVGNLAAQIFARCGFEVTAIDPLESRRELARSSGLIDVRKSLDDGPSLEGCIDLALECSGHEQGALDGCRCVRKRGEVVLIGTPWKRHTEIFAHELLKLVFKRYVVLRSGWEWEIPLQPADFAGHSLMENYAAALKWLADGSLRVRDFAAAFPPDQAKDVYQGLQDRSLATPCALFDWRTG